MTTLKSASSLFLSLGGDGSGGGGGTSVTVINGLTSTSVSAALSANQGKVLKDLLDELRLEVDEGSTVAVVNNLESTAITEALSANQGRAINLDLQEHKKLVASELEYGHVKIDNETIKINSDGQLYVDLGTGNLSKNEFVFKPTTIGQSEFEFALVNYKPENYVDLLFYNTTKVHGSDYTIEVVNEDTFTYKIVLSKPVTSLNAVYNLAIIYNDSKDNKVRMTKLEYVMNPSPTDSSVIEIPFNTYNPDTYINLLFNNTVKVHPDEYQILPKNNLDLTKGYYIKLLKPPTNPTKTFYNLVFITNGLTSGGGYVDVSKFYEGSIAPLDKSLIWIKTS